MTRGVFRMVAFLLAPICLLTGALVLVPRATPSGHRSVTLARHRTRGSTARKLTRIERQTQGLRRLHALHPVHVRFLRSAAFSRYVAGVYRKGDPPNVVRIAREEGVLTGLISPSVNLSRILTKGLVSQVVGLYDKYSKRLYIRNLGGALTLDRWTVAHEFTHALQDQHFNLKRVEPDQMHWRLKDSDAQLAEHSVVEGDAVRIQYAYLYDYYSPAQIRALQRQQASYHTQSVPPLIDEQFNFPYVSGLQYVERLYRFGGYRAVNSAFRHPPHTTYQVMFPARHIRLVDLRIVRMAGRFRHWKVIDDDVDGAFGYKQLVEPHVRGGLDIRLAGLWRGDRYLLLRHGHRFAMFMESVYATKHDARVGAKIIGASLVGRFHSHGRRFLGGYWYDRRRIASAIHVSGRRIVLAFSTKPITVERLALSRPVG